MLNAFCVFAFLVQKNFKESVRAKTQIACNEQGLVLLGYLKNVCRQLKPNNDLEVEVMN